MISLRKIGGRSLLGLAALFLTFGVAQATVILDTTMTVVAANPTQLGRLSRNGIPQDWSNGEPFPGLVNLTTAYHYTTLDINLAALQAPYVAYGQFIQVNFDSVPTTTFLSAYLDSYNPLNLQTNWLGDAGTSGNFFGIDPLFFQVTVASPHHLILVLNETTFNGGLNLPGRVLVEAFTDTEYTDLVPRAVVPEPGTWALLMCGLALLAARRFRRGTTIVRSTALLH